MKDRTTTIVQISAVKGVRERWRGFAESDPELRILPAGRRLSKFVELAVESRIEKLQAAAEREG